MTASLPRFDGWLVRSLHGARRSISRRRPVRLQSAAARSGFGLLHRSNQAVNPVLNSWHESQMDMVLISYYIGHNIHG